MTPSAMDWTMASDWVMSRSVRLSWRSATAPAQAPRMSIGPNWKAVSRPRATPECVRCSTSRVWVIIVNQVPVWLTSWPEKKRRKLRTRSERKVSWAAEWSFSVIGLRSSVREGGFGGVRAEVGPGHQALEHVDRARERGDVVGRELGQAGGEPGGLAGPQPGEEPVALRGDRHPL